MASRARSFDGSHGENFSCRSHCEISFSRFSGITTFTSNCECDLYIGVWKISAGMARKRVKTTEKEGRRVRSTKIAALVVSAIQDLRETKGSTPKKIAGYISYASNMSEQLVQRQVSAMSLSERICWLSAVKFNRAAITQFVVFIAHNKRARARGVYVLLLDARVSGCLRVIFAISQLIECYKHLNNNTQHPRDAVDSSKKR